ncbi:MAG: tetratricopeptide repeat protein [Thermoanaerobaculia bacterium]
MRSMRPWVPLLALLWLLPVGVRAAGSTEDEGMTSEEQAEEAYRRAVRYRDEAKELEAGNQPERAAKEYEKAARSLRAAIGFDPNLHQAHSDLGFALRKLGDYEGSLEEYERALELSPGYPEAIEYRAEAYLGLGRLDDVRDAYMELLRENRPFADQLMTAMKRWVEERRVEPGDMDSATVEDFAQWVEERERAASQTAELGGDGPAASGW